MERIGIAASKIAKGNILLYHFFVAAISILLGSLIFFICGILIVLVLFTVAHVINFGNPVDLQKGWIPIIKICLLCLAVAVGLLAVYAVIKNIKLRKK